MKQLFLLSIILATFSTSAHSETLTVRAIATDVITTYGTSFSQTADGPALADDAAIQSIIASDPAAAIFGLGSSTTDYSVIDLGFVGEDKVLTGSIADLVVFSLWSGHTYGFGLQVFGTDLQNPVISNDNYTVNATKGEKKTSSIFDCFVEIVSGNCAQGIVTTSINLKDLDDGIEIDYVSLFIGGDFYNGDIGGLDAYSNFSLVGAYHTDAVVVPLPLSAILFSSGLTLLGWVGCRKSKLA